MLQGPGTLPYIHQEQSSLLAPLGNTSVSKGLQAFSSHFMTASSWV